jgi:hypothetical protein
VAGAWGSAGAERMLGLLRHGDPRDLVRALCAVARLVCLDSDALATIDAAERWARGLLCVHEVCAYANWLYGRRRAIDDDGPVYQARVAAHYAAYAAYAPPADRAKVDRESAIDSVLTVARNRGILEPAAAAIRGAVPVPPTLAQLLAARAA